MFWSSAGPVKRHCGQFRIPLDGDRDAGYIAALVHKRTRPLLGLSACCSALVLCLQILPGPDRCTTGRSPGSLISCTALIFQVILFMPHQSRYLLVPRRLIKHRCLHAGTWPVTPRPVFKWRPLRPVLALCPTYTEADSREMV
jgi:hypothetical protein